MAENTLSPQELKLKKPDAIEDAARTAANLGDAATQAQMERVADLRNPRRMHYVTALQPLHIQGMSTHDVVVSDGEETTDVYDSDVLKYSTPGCHGD